MVSVTQIHTGTVNNVIPGTAYINGTIRTFDPEVQAMVKRRMGEIVAGQAASLRGRGGTGFTSTAIPATVNDARTRPPSPPRWPARSWPARTAVDDDNMPKVMGAEDFAYMLEARPGAYLMLGQGEGAGLHHPKFNFNDEIAPIGASFFAQLVERAQPVARG